MWIDAHAHLTDVKIQESHIDEAIRLGIQGFLMGGIHLEEWQKQIELSKKYQIYGVFGVHPWEVVRKVVREAEENLQMNLMAENISSLRHFCHKNISHCYAIGETGLDYSQKINKSSYQSQKEYFIEHLKLANELQKPLVLHLVNSHDDALQIIHSSSPHCGGIVHSFSGDESLAQKYLELGFYPSIGARVLSRAKGPVYQGLIQAIKALKLGDFVIETDAPDQKPLDSSCLIHEPKGLIEVAKKIATIKDCDFKEVLDASTERLKKIYAIH